MESIYAALLLHKANKKITEANLEKVLEAAGTKVDKTELTKLIAGLKEVKIEDIIKSAGSAPVMVTPSAAPKTEKKEEKKKEEEEEEEPTGKLLRIPEMAGIGSLF